MSDYGDLTSKILDDLHRDDLTSQVSLAIQSAIDFYGGERFWFNEARATASTQSGQEFYDLPDDFVDIDSLIITINNYSYPLIQRDYQQTDSWYVSSNNYTGYPSDFAIYEEQLRLYPIPNGTYTMTISYQKRLADLSASGDSNAWTNQARNLIRFYADADVSLNTLQDDDRFATFKAQEGTELMRLRSEAQRRVMRGKTRKRNYPTYRW
jgi:hypothetical protein